MFLNVLKIFVCCVMFIGVIKKYGINSVIWLFLAAHVSSPIKGTFMFNKFNKYKTSNSTNVSLVIMNGSMSLSNLKLGNILINGQAILGKKSEETTFTDIVVVNGNLNSKYASFETLEINGNSELESCNVAKQGEFFGNAVFKNCTLNNLELRGKNFVLKDTSVTGNIMVSVISGTGKLILDNTIVRGTAKFINGNGNIVFKNGGRVEGDH